MHHVRLIKILFAFLVAVFLFPFLILITFRNNSRFLRSQIVPKYKGRIISVNLTRYQRTAGILEKFGIQPLLVEPVPFNSDLVQWAGSYDVLPDMRIFQKALSNKYSHKKALLETAFDPDLSDSDWSFIFEDDINIHSQFSPSDFQAVLQGALDIANDIGVVYLGLCAPQCGFGVRNVTANVQARRCFGACSHAYGIKQGRALWFYDELRALQPGEDRRDKDYAYFDVQMITGFSAMPELRWPFLIGSNLHEEGTPPEHFGIIYQDRASFPPRILVHE